MDLYLKNKTALVTGSTAGIGFAIAKLLANEGAKVIVNGRTQTRVDDAIQQIKKEIPTANLVSAAYDLASLEGVNKITKEIHYVDILVNNLGVYAPKAYDKLTDEDWINIFNTNVMSGVRLSRHYMPSMLKQNWGRIVFISSESALHIPVEMIHYGMTKTAQLAISRGLAEATAGTAVTVNCVLAGATSSEGVGSFIDKMAKEKGVNVAAVEKEFFEVVRPTQLLKRFTSPDEVAAMVAYVCSPLSSATNGAALRADGGTVRAIV